MEKSALLLKWCRICSSQFQFGTYIFGKEARRSFLHAKIRRYLAVTISVDDDLPKMICEGCCNKLDNFHRFATAAMRNQEKMTNLFFSNSTIVPTKEYPQTKSLLHTYLTKGIKEAQESEAQESTEVEVRIDPMVILQCCLEESQDKKEDEQTNLFEAKTKEIEDDKSIISETTDEEADEEESHLLPLLSSSPQSFAPQIASIWNELSNRIALKTSNNVQLNNVTEILTDQNDASDSGGEDMDIDTDVDDVDENNANNDNGMEKHEAADDDRFACPVCGKDISTKGNLKVHLETHRPKGKYDCDICGRIFKTQCNLFRHKEYHGGIQYPCVVCGRVYPTNSTLRAHSITHSDLRPHKCPLCDKTFKRNQDLKFHINQHTGARPYQCPYCPKAFASSGNCFSHRKRMHPIEVERDREKAAKIMR